MENAQLLYFKFVEDFGNDWFFLLTIQIELDFASAIVPVIRAIQVIFRKFYGSYKI